MPNEQRNPNLTRLSAELTDGSETDEFKSNEPLIQNRTGWDSSLFNESPAGPLTDIGEGRSGQHSDPTNDYADRSDDLVEDADIVDETAETEATDDDEYHVTTSWGSGTDDLPLADNEAKGFKEEYVDHSETGEGSV